MIGNKIGVTVHFVWATWDRLPLITREIERDLYRSIVSICGELGCSVLAIGGMPDHVHLLVSMSTTVSLGDLMKRVKAGSSRFVSERFKPESGFKWQGSYGAFSVAVRDRSRIVGYIRDQKHHHAPGGRLWPEAESPGGASE